MRRGGFEEEGPSCSGRLLPLHPPPLNRAQRHASFGNGRSSPLTKVALSLDFLKGLHGAAGACLGPQMAPLQDWHYLEELCIFCSSRTRGTQTAVVPMSVSGVIPWRCSILKTHPTSLTAAEAPWEGSRYSLGELQEVRDAGNGREGARGLEAVRREWGSPPHLLLYHDALPVGH